MNMHVESVMEQLEFCKSSVSGPGCTDMYDCDLIIQESCRIYGIDIDLCCHSVSAASAVSTSAACSDDGSSTKSHATSRRSRKSRTVNSKMPPPTTGSVSSLGESVQSQSQPSKHCKTNTIVEHHAALVIDLTDLADTESQSQLLPRVPVYRRVGLKEKSKASFYEPGHFKLICFSVVAKHASRSQHNQTVELKQI